MISARNIVQIGNYSYYPTQILGQGATGKVYKGYVNQNKQPIAVKVIDLRTIKTKVKKNLLACEIQALTKMNHKNVIKTYEILKDDEYYFIPMSFCSNGTLRHYVKAKKKLHPQQALDLFTKIVEGYEHIIKKNFVHRDLKTENILFTNHFQPVIIDFGYCEKINTQSKRLSYNVGSPAYMSPQAYNESFYSEKSDIWALGVIFHEMLTGDIPKIKIQDVDNHFKELSFQETARIFPQITDQHLKKILLSALTVEISQRPNCSQLLNLIKRKQMSPQQFHAYTPQSMPAMNLYNTPSSTNLSQSANLGNIQHQPQQNQHYQQNMNLVQSANLGQVMTMPPSALRKTLSFQNVNNINLPTQNFIKAKPNPELRKTMPNNPNFTSLRKKITLQTNVVPTLPLFQSDRKINIDSQKKNTGLTNRGYRNIEPFIISPEKNQQNKIGRSISENELVLNRRL